jgi:hypothetical protein
MGLTITDRTIRSPCTPHTATARTVRDEPALWAVTWLPGRNLTQDQAEAAMKIAEAVWEMPPDCGPELYDDTFWPRMDALAAEIGLSGPDAVARASEPPEDIAARTTEGEQANDN